MEMIGVVYMSRATRPMSSDDLDRLLLEARTHNAVVGITGVLLYGEGQFFQYLEGHSADVERVYEHIRRSTLHTDLVELEKRKITQRLFRKWFMGFRESPASFLQKLSQEEWSREKPPIEARVAVSPGMKLLGEFLDVVSA